MRDFEMFYGYWFRRDPYGAGLGGRKFKSVFRSTFVFNQGRQGIQANLNGGLQAEIT